MKLRYLGLCGLYWIGFYEYVFRGRVLSFTSENIRLIWATSTIIRSFGYD